MPKTSRFRQSFRLLLPAVIALLMLAAPAHGQWYQESTIDISQLNYRLSGGGYGLDFAIFGDRAIVGGAKDAYIFERNSAGQWNQTTTVNVARPLPTMDYFPVRVAIDGDNVAVGAHNSPTSYVLHRDAPGTWSSTSLAGSAMDIDISGNTALLCYSTDWGNYGQRIFDRQTDGSWIQTAVLPIGAGAKTFGTAGAISGNRVLIADMYKAYLSERDSTGTWSTTATLGSTSLLAFAGCGVDLDGSTAITGGMTALYAQDSNAAWTQVPTLPSQWGSLPVAVDGDSAIMLRTGAFTIRRDANGNWTETQYLGGVLSYFSNSQTVAAGGDKLAVVGTDKKVRVYAYDSSPRLFYSSFDAGTNLADLGFTTHADPEGKVQIDTNGRLALTCPYSYAHPEGTVGISKMLDCDEQVTFTFDYSAAPDTPGSLQLTLGGVVLDTITSRYGTYRQTFTLADFGLEPGQLEWKLDHTNAHGATAFINDLFITTIPEPATLSLLGLGALALRRRR